MSDDELQPDIIDEDETTETFNLAIKHLPQLMGKVNISQDDLLYLYARYKHSTEGPCNTKRPGFLEFQAKKKWDSWHSVKDITQQDAQSQYVAKIKELDPSWEIPTGAEKSKSAASWISVSTMSADCEIIPEEIKDIFDWCRDGNMEKVKDLLEILSIDVNAPDENGMSLLHWACDRGHIDIVKYLISKGAEVNVTDVEGQTPLHSSCACGHEEVTKVLLQNTANLNCKDSQGETPEQVAYNEEITKLITSWKFWAGGESPQ